MTEIAWLKNKRKKSKEDNRNKSTSKHSNKKGFSEFFENAWRRQTEGKIYFIFKSWECLVE